MMSRAFIRGWTWRALTLLTVLLWSGVILAVMMAVAAPAGSQQLTRFAVVSSVYDGDSFRVYDGTKTIPIRIMGIDTPELQRHGGGRYVPDCEKQMAQRARQYLMRLGVRPEQRVGLRIVGPDKYQRTLAWVTVRGQRVDELMINSGHARPYMGGRRHGGWC